MSDSFLEDQAPGAYHYLALPPTLPPPWPLLLFLHGAGERGGDLALVRLHGPPREAERGRLLPFLLLAPQCPAGKVWEVPRLAALLDHAEARWPLDRDRVVVTGLSMGGFGTWALAQAWPERLAAIVPICGGGDPRLARRLLDLPTWAFHGARDPTVPLEQSVRMVRAIEKLGGEARFTVDQHAEHDCWTKAYGDDALWTWMAARRRS